MIERSTKEKILTAARQLFVQHGFAGTSMGKIAKLAEVNHSLIFHHFGNKDQLWVEVKMSIAQDSAHRSKILPDMALPFESFLREMVVRGLAFYRSSSDIVRMMNWQRLESSDQNTIGIGPSRESQSWIEAFEHYQKNGDINPSLEPHFIMAFVLSVISSAALDPNLYVKEKVDQEAYIDFCVGRFQKALA